MYNEGGRFWFELLSLAAIVLPMSRYEGLTVVSGMGDGMLVQ